ncbi:endonuclease/exonuclease/phosphatase family protein [Pedobacter sp. GR22-6]|uniref:endonuclease/exonuclease/phosphatase family protein n=1 Tax=Pedobacter sp. GR22-6 TaxID=3127957 RepID=UPI00307E973A
MRYLLFLFLFTFNLGSFAQELKVCSWNIQNFGKSKDDVEMAYIAKQVNQFDLIAIQEVVASAGGPQAVARLADELNRMGSQWDYAISNPTTGKARERYAFLWRTSKVQKKGDAWLEQKYEKQIEREPYFCRFIAGKASFTMASFHAVPKSKLPATEIKYLKFLPARYPSDKLIFCGDFNLPQSNNVFYPLKDLGYKPVLVGQKTSLKQECVADNCLASEYDNFFFRSSELPVVKSGILHFYSDFADMLTARAISDHVPVFIYLSLN